MTASESPITNGSTSTIDPTFIDTTEDPAVDSKEACHGRNEETTPRTSPDPDPRQMEDELQADGVLKDGESAPLENTEHRAVTGSARR